MARLVGLGAGNQLALFEKNVERGFNETDLRAMLDDAVQLVEQSHGTFLVVTTLADRPWEVIVSPDEDHRLVVVVTAYPC